MSVVVLPRPPDRVLGEDAPELRDARDRGAGPTAAAEAHDLDPRPVCGPRIRLLERRSRIRPIARKPEVTPAQPPVRPPDIVRRRTEQEQTPARQTPARSSRPQPPSAKTCAVWQLSTTPGLVSHGIPTFWLNPLVPMDVQQTVDY